MSGAGISPRHIGSDGRAPGAAGRHRIGEAARLVGVSPSALRLWERQGLIQPDRTPAGYRLYSDADLEQLQRVQRMRTERVSAPGIRRLIPVPNRTSPPTPDRRDRVLDGRRVRALRTQRGLSLREASRLSGLSVSFLSAIERDATGVSLATLHRLTAAYGVTLLDLFETGRGAGHRLRSAERPTLELGTGVRIEQLAVDAQQLEPQLFTLSPGATSQGEYAHIGEEFLFVLDGELTFWVGDDERYRLRTGDALTFPSNLPHRWRNRAGGETRLLWINTPPTF
ncbi:MAG TPA: cupin domain-containing protein [Candidatus Limnocylindrales bacterium]|nr:cupin domain-containing protein [Candidatus Limnocylindrales bacterium]